MGGSKGRRKNKGEYGKVQANHIGQTTMTRNIQHRWTGKWGQREREREIQTNRVERETG